MNKLLFAVGLIGLVLPRAMLAANPPPIPADLLVDAEAILQKWAPPDLPADVSSNPGERVSVVARLVIDLTGKVSAARVLRSPDPRLADAALAAVRTWTFLPAMEDSKPVQTCLDVTVQFASPAHSGQGKAKAVPRPIPRPSPVTEAEVKSTPDADYPDELVARKLPGAVQFVCSIDAQGHRSNPQVVHASHVAFVLPALAAIAKWDVAPAHKGDIPRAADLRGEVTFDPPAKNHAEVLAANFVTAPDGSEPSDIPVLQEAPDPIWPYERLLAGQGGEAKVTFTVGMDGGIEDVAVQSASQPEFGQALAAAVALWRFDPAARDGQGVAVPLAVHWTFAALTGDDAVAPDYVAFQELVKAANAKKISPASGLDRKLRPIFRKAPIYPPSLAAAGRPAGDAVINVVIARDGRVRLPQIVSASQEAFGWAAATAAAQWVFDPPMRAGKPVDIKIQVPFHFVSPPEG